MDQLKVKINADLAYLLGVVVGDGYIKEIKRKKGGYYHELLISAESDFIRFLDKIFYKVFRIKSYVYREKRRKDCLIMRIHSHPLFYFLKSMGFRPGKKAGNIPKIKHVYKNKTLFKHFLAGLIDTDGYVGSGYACLVQKDMKFLRKIKRESKNFLDLDFSKVKINRVYKGMKYGWIYTRNLKAFNDKIPLRYPS